MQKTLAPVSFLHGPICSEENASSWKEDATISRTLTVPHPAIAAANMVQKRFISDGAMGNFCIYEAARRIDWKFNSLRWR